MTAGRRLRLSLEVFRLMFSLDLRRALLALTPIVAGATLASYLSARSLLRAARAGDDTGVAVAVIVFAVAFLLTAWIGRVARTSRLQLGEATLLSLQLRRAQAVLRPRHTTDLEHRRNADRVALLESRSFEVSQAPRMFGWMVDSLGGLLVSVGLLLAVDPRLVLVAIGGLPATLLNGREQAALQRARTAEMERTRRAQLVYDLATHPSHADEVRVAGLEDELFDRYSTDWRHADRAQYRAELRAGGIAALGWLAQLAAFVIAVVVLIRGVRDGSVPPENLFLALGAMGLIVGQVGQAVSGVTSLGQITSIFGELEDLEASLPAPPTSFQGRPLQPAPRRLQRGIQMRNVSFRYDGATADALSNVTVDLPAGSVVAVVGDNGAGKSTFVKMLFGLSAPTSGAVLIDGVDLLELDHEDWRQRTSGCFQDHLNLQLVARESIGAGDLDHVNDAERVHLAAERALASQLLERLPAGLDTRLGLRLKGSDLSGGEWQRVAIARAMMRRDLLLLALDEPSAALDPLAEREIFQQYRTHSRELVAANGTITVLVTHRFSTVGLADLIVVLDQGCVAEIGDHAELVAAGGIYAEMYELQARHFR